MRRARKQLGPACEAVHFFFVHFSAEEETKCMVVALAQNLAVQFFFIEWDLVIVQ